MNALQEQLYDLKKEVALLRKYQERMLGILVNYQPKMRVVDYQKKLGRSYNYIRDNYDCFKERGVWYVRTDINDKLETVEE